MSLYLYRSRNLIRVLRRLVREEFEERGRAEEDRDRPIRREGCGDNELILQLFNQVIQSRNHISIHVSLKRTYVTCHQKKHKSSKSLKENTFNKPQSSFVSMILFNILYSKLSFSQ